MSLRTIFLGRLIGLFALLVSLAMFIHRQSFVETASALLHDRPLMLILGMMALIGGLAIVLSHSVWSGGAFPVVVSLCGWVVLFRGLFLLFLAPDAIASLFEVFRFEELFYLYAFIPLILGLYLTYAGFAASPGATAATRV